MNRIELIGNVTKDVEVTTTSNGTKVSNFNLAVKMVILLQTFTLALPLIKRLKFLQVM